MRQWKLAEEYFSMALEKEDGDFLTSLYLERSRQFSRTPPGEDWEGVITFSEK